MRSVKTSLGVEALEDRNLLDSHPIEIDILPFPDWDATVTLHANGLLTIRGTPYSDSVFISESDGTLSVDSFSSGPPWMVRPMVMQHQEFAAGDVKMILFRGRAGDDTFENDTGITSFAFGGLGNDRLLGGGAFDVLRGGQGDDSLVGGQGHDILLGSAGNDVIDCRETSPEYDLIFGGPGEDEFLIDEGVDVRFTGLVRPAFLKPVPPTPIDLEVTVPLLPTDPPVFG